jgi:hypothetical protein
LTARIQATCENAARSDEGGLLKLRVPEILVGFTSMARWSERKHPLFLGPPRIYVSELVIHPPPGGSLSDRPEDVSITDGCVSVKASWTQGEDGVVRLEQRLRRTCPVVSVEGYPSFRAALNRLKRVLEEEVVISTTPREPAGKEKKKKARTKTKARAR